MSDYDPKIRDEFNRRADERLNKPNVEPNSFMNEDQVKDIEEEILDARNYLLLFYQKIQRWKTLARKINNEVK